MDPDLSLRLETDGDPPPVGFCGLRVDLRQEKDATADLPGADGGQTAVGALSLPDPSRLPPALCQGRAATVSAGGDAPDPSAAAVVHALRSSDGGDADRYPVLSPLCRDRPG